MSVSDTLSSQPYAVKLYSSISALFPHVTYKRRTGTKECCFAHGHLYTYSLTKQIEMTAKSFDVSLTVHLSITLANDQLDAQIFNTFIAVLYMHMFRAVSCSFSGGQIV
jgi:hypothetical protein